MNKQTEIRKIGDTLEKKVNAFHKTPDADTQYKLMGDIVNLNYRYRELSGDFYPLNFTDTQAKA